MNEGIQKKLENIGKYGCYFLCLLKAAKWDENEIIKAYDEALKKGYIESDCYVCDPNGLAKFLFKIPLKVVKTNEKPNGAVFYVEYWYNPDTKLHHFKLPNWDPLGKSNTVSNGYIESYRAFYG